MKANVYKDALPACYYMLMQAKTFVTSNYLHPLIVYYPTKGTAWHLFSAIIFKNDTSNNNKMCL